jgi:hypothetical protein
MSVPITEQKILQIRSGNHCAFPGCDALLVKASTFGTRPVVTGEIAHIVSETPEGPRGKHALPSGEHNKHTNLLFICSTHHTEIDTQPEVYTVERLRQMKRDHEDSIEKAVAQAKVKDQSEAIVPLVNEVVHSTLLPVIRMPKFIFSGPCKYGDSQEREAAREVLLKETQYLCPFIIRGGGTLFAFTDLRKADGPFRNIVDHSKAVRSLATSWWDDPDKSKWVATLLNRTLNKLTGRKKLQLDKDHHRYFFNVDEPGKAKSVQYRPLNQSMTERKVVWQPVRKKTNELRPFWNHLAVSLRFEYLGKEQWCFCIRPEMRITKDGIEPLESKKIGSRVTKQKSHMFNYDLLEDVNFWRDFLSSGQPRIVLKFENNAGIAISTTLMSATVQWPGIPEEHAKPFVNVDYEENLFTALELQDFPEEDLETTHPNESEEDEEEGPIE